MKKLLQTFESSSEEETRRWGKKFGASLKKGDVVGIIGPFGAGKTRLIKAICENFGIPPGIVTSPSFTLIHEYSGTEKVVHLDTYRLETDTEFEMLDLDYYFDRKAIILIEWADRVSHLLPEATKMIEVKIKGKNKRKITLKENKPSKSGKGEKS